MSNTNPLIEHQPLDTLCNIENHLRFINDYFLLKHYDPDLMDEREVLHGLCKTLDMSIDALRHLIEQQEVT